MSTARDDDVLVRLTHAEALVLFELLARADDDGVLANVDDADERVLRCIEAQLERVLSEPFRADYADLVNAARKTVRES